MLGKRIPLAERLRPQSIDEVIGQDHLVGKNGVVRKMIAAGSLPSLIFWGPPGVGKTTIAGLLASAIKANFYSLSAINAGVKEVREVIQKAKTLGKCVLFLDEIHRFSKSQQDALLGAVEKGLIILIGATTENPSFEVNNALLSRCQVYVLNALTEKALLEFIDRALENDSWLAGKKVTIKETSELFRLCGGDGRRLLNLLEIVVEGSGLDEVEVTNEFVGSIVQQKALNYDKKGDMHYDVISAFIKSIRGSDPNAAVYWLARMIEAGEDAKFIARRLLILASEDIGNANPTALVIANNCFQAISVIGYPEARIILSQATVYLASSAKSNSAYEAINKAQQVVKEMGDLSVPLHLRGGYTELNRNLGYGKEYKYAHEFENNFIHQEYMPNKLSGLQLFSPAHNARENDMRKRLASLWKEKYKY